VTTGTWSILEPLAATVQASLDEVDAELRDHFTAAARRHAAAAIDYTPHGFVASATVQAAVNELIDKLSSATAGSSGGTRVAVDAAAGSPNALAAGTVKTQLAALLGFLNTHVGAASGAHNASAIAVADAGNNLNAANVETALTEILDAYEGDHFRGNESNPGQHRAIRQPNLGGTKALLWDSLGNGSVATRLRVYADSDSIWFTLNASWNGSAWARDDTGYYSGGFRTSRLEFELFHETTFAATFTTWSRTWRLPMSSTTNSAFELTGTVQEVGRCALQWSNADTATRTLGMGGSVTFRNRFPATPSSITFSSLSQSGGFSGNPNTYFPDRDGFGLYSYQSIPALGTVFWYGTYTAVA
jgi:hypothetical protein